RVRSGIERLACIDVLLLCVGLATRLQQAAHVLVAAVVAGARIAVEEAILIRGIHVVARDAGSERVFSIVRGTRAFGIEPIDLAIGVVVGAVGALHGTANRAFATERRRVYRTAATTISGPAAASVTCSHSTTA